MSETENQRYFDYERNAASEFIVNGRLVRRSGDNITIGDRAVKLRRVDADKVTISTTNESYAWNPPVLLLHSQESYAIKVNIVQIKVYFMHFIYP